MAAGSMGHQARLYVEPGAGVPTFDSSSESYEFVRESLRKTATIGDTNGLRGSRSHYAARTRETQESVGGSILLNPSPNDLELWLPRIMGSASIGVLAETLPAFAVLVNRVAQTFRYDDCYVSRGTFRGSAGGMIELELDILGKSETTGTSAPSVTLGLAADDAPYVLSDGVFTIAGAAREVFDFEIVIDNALEARFVNSLTATDIHPTDRIITVRATCPYESDHDDLYEQAVAGAAATIAFTNGSVSTSFAFAALQVPAVSPIVDGRGEIRIEITGTARRTSGTAELVVTNDATP